MAGVWTYVVGTVVVVGLMVGGISGSAASSSRSVTPQSSANAQVSPNPQVLEVVTEATTINHFVDLGAPGPSPGDTYTFSDTLLAKGDLTQQVGRADGHCILIDPAARRFTCTITSSLPSGDITTEGILVFVPGAVSVGAVTGGTGSYRNARGEARLTLGPVVGVPGAQHQATFLLILIP